MYKPSIILLVLVLLGGLMACQQEPKTPMPLISIPEQQLTNAKAQQTGAALFKAHCRECHGSLTEGRNPRASRFNPVPPDFFNSAYATIDPAYLFWRIKEGKRIEPFRSRGSVMPAWGPYLSEQEIWSLVAYLRHRAGAGGR
jgi:mono/diheme cytochrome c family protein